MSPKKVQDHFHAEFEPQSGENDIAVSETASIHSATSTIRYELEPFENYRIKVAQVVAQCLKRDLSEITINRMKGGSYNRVAAVTITPKRSKFSIKWLKSQCLGAWCKSAAKQVDSYIIRIPRIKGDGNNTDVAILKAVHARLLLPTPEVVAYDFTDDNLLKSPFMIQKRLSGHNLAELWKILNIEQKKCVTKRLVEIVSTIASVKATPGDLSADNITKARDGQMFVEKFRKPIRGQQPSFEKPETWTGDVQKPIDHLLERCDQWREYEESDGFCFEEIWDGFTAISKALEARGFLDGPCVLSHGDLFAYNLLAEISSKTEVKVTAVIDWDYATISPEFMTYRAPFWLWLSEGMDSSAICDESLANFEPVTDEDRTLKQLFLDHASDKYQRFAFSPEATLARRMYPLLRNGMHSNQDYDTAVSVIREWSQLHPGDGVKAVQDDSDFEPDCSSVANSEASSDNFSG